MHSPRFIAALFALLALAAPAQAQAISQLRTGDWLRVQTLGGARTTGKLVLLDDKGIQIESAEGPAAFSLADVQRLEVSRGRRKDEGALIGAGIGLVGGILFGAALAAGDTGSGGANMAVIGVPLFAIPAGMWVGSLSAPRRYLVVARPYRM
jgi:hypothetical protein